MCTQRYALHHTKIPDVAVSRLTMVSILESFCEPRYSKHLPYCATYVVHEHLTLMAPEAEVTSEDEDQGPPTKKNKPAAAGGDSAADPAAAEVPPAAEEAPDAAEEAPAAAAIPRPDPAPKKKPTQKQTGNILKQLPIVFSGSNNPRSSSSSSSSARSSTRRQ